jgi:hypothetical protein
MRFQFFSPHDRCHSVDISTRQSFRSGETRRWLLFYQSRRDNADLEPRNESIQLWPGLERSLLGRPAPALFKRFPVTCEIRQFGSSAVLFGRAAPLVQFQTGRDRPK